MKKKITTVVKDIIKDIRTYMALLAIVGSVFAYLNKWIVLPGQVQAIANDVMNNTQEIENVTANFEQYIAIQAVKEDKDEKYQKEVLDLLKQLIKDKEG